MKKMNSVADLAINGASPAFAEPLHVGRPNLGSREAFLAYANAIFDRRWLSNNGPLVQEFERRVADFLGVKQCVAMGNGTIAPAQLERWGERVLDAATLDAAFSRARLACSPLVSIAPDR